MIAKMKSNLSAKETLMYNHKEKSETISINNLTGENIHDIEQQMIARQKLFEGRAKNLTAHIILSPSIEDGKKQTMLDWKEIGSSFLQKAGLTSHQSIAFLHLDKTHYHLHLVVNRIDATGKLYRHYNELAMSQRIGDEIAMERGLTRASKKRNENKFNKTKGVKTDDDVGIVAQMKRSVSNAAVYAWENEKFNQEKYFQEIKADGFDINFFYKKDHDGKTTDEVRGYAIGKKGEHYINASDIGAEFSLEKLKRRKFNEPTNTNTKSIKIKIQEDLDRCFDRVVEKEGEFSSEQFLKEIKSMGYVVKEYLQKDTNRLRGYGIEDSEGNIINASEIGHGYTFVGLKKRFNEIKITPLIPKTKREEKRKANAYKIYNTNIEAEKSPGDQISDELRRAIDIELICQGLKDLTSGHRYRSYDEFIKAIEGKGYRVHLRYNGGRLSGYTIHVGTHHYHDNDNEIGNGQFAIDQLMRREVIVKKVKKRGLSL